MKNKYGRPWEYLDFLKTMDTVIERLGDVTFSVVSYTGVPLCGKVINGDAGVRLITAKDWS